MIRRYGPHLLAAQFVSDLALTLLAVKIAEQLRLHIVTHLEQREQFLAVQPWVYPLVLAIWCFFFFLLGVFDVDRRDSLAADLWSLGLSITLSMLVLASLFYLLAPNPPNAPSRLFYAYFYVVDISLIMLAHGGTYYALTIMRKRGRHVRRLLLVGEGVRGRHVAVRLRGRETAGVTLVGYLSAGADVPVPDLPRLGDAEDLLAVVREYRVDEVIMAMRAESHGEALRLTSQLGDMEVPVRILPDVFEMVAMKARVEDFYGLPLISIREPSITPIQARVKRTFDVAISAILLVVFSPIMLLIALWVKLDSDGPVFFHQRRIGVGGQPFRMHKFRSMAWAPERHDEAATKRPGDPRVTRAGRFLRRTSLDELPQLWNVLRGEMSLVGPRPELPAIVDLYEPWQKKRFLVPPGMTGWWQINGRSERSMHLNTEIDLYYVQNYSILLDLQILVRTLGAVIRGKGAY